MNELIKVLPNYKKFNSYIEDVKKGVSPIMLSGLTDVGKVHFAYATNFYVEKPICIVTYNEMQAKKILKDMQYFSEEVIYFPKRDILSFDILAESKDTLYDRIECLNRIREKKAKVIVTTIEAVSQKMISKDTLYRDVFTLNVGKNYSLEDIKEKLIHLGYERLDMVEAKGQFSVRGGILDIATSEKHGTRIEFWGDEIDSIRTFDIASQRSTEMQKQVTIYPCIEFVLEKETEKVAETIENQEDRELIKNGEYINKIDKYFNNFYQKQETFLDYIEKDTILFIDEIGKIKARIENILKDRENLIKSLLEKKRDIPQSIKNIQNYIEFLEILKKKQTIYLEKQDIGFVDKQSMHAKRNGYSFSYREVNFFRSSMDLLPQEIQESTEKGKRIIILAGSEENCSKIMEFLKQKEPRILWQNLKITVGALSAGFESYDFELLVISAENIFTSTATRSRISNRAFKQGETIVFADLKVGDYVVHKTSGIGQFIGVNRLKADGVIKDYIKIRYKDDDILYVPTNALDSIRKYIGTGEGTPKINRLGSKEWEQTKSKVKSNLQEVARDLIELYAKRQKITGFAFSKDTEWQKQFEDSFPYIETDDQLRCIEEIKKDMEKDKPMDRLLCGDVGYGKTEVAIRGAFKACMDQKQVAYLVPTTILANQQYESFRERMKEFPIRIELLNRFRTKKEQEEIIRKLKLGEIDIIVGTHRLLSKDVEFKNLGLLIIDEEHRFRSKR